MTVALTSRFPDRRSAPLKLLFILAAALIPASYVLLGGLYPEHDSLLAYQHFAYVYSSLRQFHEIPSWNPYVGYGLTTSPLDLTYVGAPQYFAMAAGMLLGMDRDLTVFCVSLWASQVVYLGGLFLLSRELGMPDRHSLLLVAAATLLTQPLIQPDFNYGISWPLWMAFWLVLRYFRTFEVRYLGGLAAYGAAFFLFGHVSYGLVVQFYVIAFWSVCCAVGAATGRIPCVGAAGHIRPQDAGRRNAINATLALAAAACVAVFYWKVHDLRTNYFLHSVGRDPVTGEVTQVTFLSYGGYGGLEKLLNLIAWGSPTHDFSLFVGRFALSFALCAIVAAAARRDGDYYCNWFVACAAVLVFALLNFITPLNSPLAAAAYYLPGMSVVRHVAYYGVIGVPPLLLLAGFGIRRCAESPLVPLLALFVAVLALLALDPASASVAVLALLTLFFGKRRPVVLWLMIVAEICLHTLLYNDWAILRPRSTIASMAQSPRQGEVLAQRTQSQDSKALAAFVRATYTSSWLSRYAEEAAYLKQDFCYPSARLELVLKPVQSMAGAIDLRPWDSPEKRALYGCGTDKAVQLRPDLVAASPVQAWTAMKDSVRSGRMLTTVVDEAGRIAGRPLDGRVQSYMVRAASPDRIRLSVKVSDGLALMTIFDAVHPWWTAAVDGRATAIFPFNIAFKSVLVEPGEHVVEFRISRTARLMRWLEFLLLGGAQAAMLWLASRAVLVRGTQAS